MYADFVKMEFVYASPDGSPEVFEPDSDGAYSTIAPDGAKLHVYSPNDGTEPPETAMAIDFWATSDGGNAAFGKP